MSQVGVFLALVTPNVCTWIDGELFLQKHWLEDCYAEQRKKVGLPQGLAYQMKPEIGWELIKRTKERQIPFGAVTMDDLYGRNHDLRQKLNDAKIEYYGDVPVDTIVTLSPL
jgi:SRSO17 transposase